MAIPENPPLARDRLLLVAAETFVENGFKATSIRKICERANVNVAMVHYYFRSKEDLYLAVLDFARQQEHEQKQEMADEASAADHDGGPQEMLRGAIKRLVCNLLTPGPASLRTRLLAWELMDPSPAIGAIADKDIKPEHRLFADLVRDITGDALDDNAIQRCVFSIIGQAVFYANARRIHEIATPEITYDPAGIDMIAEHVYRFSMAALIGLGGRSGIAGTSQINQDPS